MNPILEDRFFLASSSWSRYNLIQVTTVRADNKYPWQMTLVEISLNAINRTESDNRGEYSDDGGYTFIYALIDLFIL